MGVGEGCYRRRNLADSIQNPMAGDAFLAKTAHPGGVRRGKTATLGYRNSEKVHAAKAFTNKSIDKGIIKVIFAIRITRQRADSYNVRRPLRKTTRKRNNPVVCK